MSADVKHDYHLVDPSPWPALGALAGFLVTFGTVMYMHPGALGEGLEPVFSGLGAAAILPGLILVLVTMWVWWRDVIREAEHEGHHKPVVQLGMRYGMALFIVSEVMFFVAFFWAFFNSSLYPKADPAVWPPEGVETLPTWGVPFINTIILVSSGIVLTFAHHHLRDGKRDSAKLLLAGTIALGLLFTALQAYEYAAAAFKFTDGIYSSTFYMATGFHGFHVIMGTTFLIVCWFRLNKGHFKPEHHFGFEAAAWYWHFVDVVWLFLFVCIYWWGA